jgi:hypothetical protein
MTYEDGFEDEEIPASSESKGLVDITSGETNKWTGDREVGDHLSL